MGLSASTIRKAAEASAEAGKKEESARIQLLEEMGHRVIKHFQDKVRLERNDSFEFKLGRILTERYEIRILSSESTKDFKKFAHGIVSDVAKGDIFHGISGVVEEGIDALMTSAVGSVSEVHRYAVKLNAISVERLDFYMYQYDFAASGLIKQHSKLLVYAYTTSTVQNVTPKLLRNAISLALPNDKSAEDNLKVASRLYKDLAPIVLNDGNFSEEENSDEWKQRKWKVYKRLTACNFV